MPHRHCRGRRSEELYVERNQSRKLRSATSTRDASSTSSQAFRRRLSISAWAETASSTSPTSSQPIIVTSNNAGRAGQQRPAWSGSPSRRSVPAATLRRPRPAAHDTRSQLAEDLDRILGPAPAGEVEGDSGWLTTRLSDQTWKRTTLRHGDSGDNRAGRRSGAVTDREGLQCIGDTSATETEPPSEEAAEANRLRVGAGVGPRVEGDGRSHRRGGACRSSGDEGSPQQSAEEAKSRPANKPRAADLSKPRFMESAERRTDEDDAPNQRARRRRAATTTCSFFPKDEPAPVRARRGAVWRRESPSLPNPPMKKSYDEPSYEERREGPPSTEAPAARLKKSSTSTTSARRCRRTGASLRGRGRGRTEATSPSRRGT